MIKMMKSNKGSSTVLISLFLLTLLVFAVLSITSSASELKLARRNAETNKIYYSLDAEGKRFLCDVKSAVRNALISMEDNPESFFTYLESNLGSDIKYIRSPENLTMTVERTIVLEVNSYDRHLDIKILVTQPTNESNTNEICSVLEWKLWQEPFEYNNTVDLWEGNP